MVIAAVMQVSFVKSYFEGVSLALEYFMNNERIAVGLSERPV